MGKEEGEATKIMENLEVEVAVSHWRNECQAAGHPPLDRLRWHGPCRCDHVFWANS